MAAAAWRPPGRTVACGPLQPRRSSERHRPQRRMNATRAATSAVWPRSDGLSRHAIFLSGVATHRRALKARRFPRTSCKETRRPNPLRSASHRSPPRTDVPPMHRRAAARRRCIGPKRSKAQQRRWGSDSRSMLTVQCYSGLARGSVGLDRLREGRTSMANISNTTGAAEGFSCVTMMGRGAHRGTTHSAALPGTQGTLPH